MENSALREAVQPLRQKSASLAVGYVFMLLATVASFFLIRAWGETLTAPPATDAGVRRSLSPQSDILFHLLLALAAVIILGRMIAKLFSYVGQPPVIGEVIAGILLGPSVLGWLAPEAAGYLLPQAIAPFLAVLAQLGIILYMFLIGLELNAELLRQRAHATVAVSHASIVVPFVLGAMLALWLYPRFSHQGVPFTSFALFLGVAMAITAFPVLARILTDCGMAKTELGILAMTCAATDDVTAWCLLALVVGVAQAQVEGAVLVALLTLGYIAVMFLVVRPLALRLAR